MRGRLGAAGPVDIAGAALVTRDRPTPEVHRQTPVRRAAPESSMKPLASVSLALLVVAPAFVAGDTAQVARQGQHGTVKLEHVVAGYLSELNGRYKLRVTEVTYDPGGFIGDHHHAGPGIRCVTAGELTYVEAGKTTVYRPGDCFFESGNVTHTVSNRTDKPTVLLNFEVLPADWAGSSAIPVPK